MSHWELPADRERLDDLVRDWLEAMTGVLDSETVELYRMHFTAHLTPHFGDPRAITVARAADYGRRRLRVVKRRTLQKERSTLRGFLAWCVEQGYLVDAPALPALPRRAMGTPYEQRRRGVATELSPEECRTLIDALPTWSTPRHNKPAFVVRARFVVMYETALRPATLNAISAPEHYSRGATTLRLTDSIDKARFGRELPLTDTARAALDGVAREGLLFGTHDYRDQLERAAKKTLTPAKARTFTAYDLRHARLTELAETGNLTGAAYLAGHKHVTTTSIYVRPGFHAAERALLAVESEPVTGVRLAGLRKAAQRKSCEGEDSNLHGSYPASTSSPLVGTLRSGIAAEATRLLERAALNEPVAYERLAGFAVRVLECSEVGRLVLGVVEGGDFAPRRALELAQLIASEAAAAQPEVVEAES